MKLVHSELETPLTLNNEGIFELIIESPTDFSKYVSELIHQVEGWEGNFILLKGDVELDLAKESVFITNPFDVNINDAKLLKKLYAELKEIGYEHFFIQTQELISSLEKYILELEHHSDYILEVDNNIDFNNLFKTFGVKFTCLSEDFFENIIQFIKINASLLKKTLFIFVNLKSYIDEQQYFQLMQLAEYEKVAILLIDNKQNDFSNDVNKYIIDLDRCHIY